MTVHRVDYATFTPKNGPASMVCSCGATITADCPDELDTAFHAHRRESGAVKGDGFQRTTFRVKAEHQRAGVLEVLYALDGWRFD